VIPLHGQLRWSLILAAALAAAGCSSSNEQQQPADAPPTKSTTEKEPAGPAGEKPTKVSAQDQPESLEELPQLAEGRIPISGGEGAGNLQVGFPEGWYVPQRDKRWLFRTRLSRTSNYPTITINPSQVDPGGELNEKTVVDFARRVAEHLEGKVDPGAMLGPVQPMRLGSRFAVSYATNATANDKKLAVLRVLVSVAGSGYEVKLLAIRPTLPDFQQYGYAVAMGLSAE